MSNSNQFLSTAIPYVNGAPHLGHAQELVIADAIARHRRRLGAQLHFQSGSDDNSLKCWRAAARAGLSPQALVAHHANELLELARSLDVELDDFVRTSSDARHRPAVEHLWRACQAAGDLERRHYRGLYCNGCEQFYSPGELPGDVCPEHATPLVGIAEENYFFRASRYGGAVREAIERGRLRIVPEERQREALRLLAAGLQDFSVSRSAERAHGWGIPVPGDTSQVIFVWFDALANYVSTLGYGTDGAPFARFWLNSTARSHVIGKGVLRFHAACWPALLLSAGLPLPSEILCHGYVTHEGRKIGKSLGNARPAREIVERYGPDAFRYYALRHLHTSADTDFSEQRLIGAHDSELADQLGNLVQRTLTLVTRELGGVIPAASLDSDDDRALLALADRVFDEQCTAFERFDLNQAAATVLGYLSAANRYFAAQAPWALARAGQRTRLASVLRTSIEALRRAAWLLSPIVPRGSARTQAALGAEPAVEHVKAGQIRWRLLAPRSALHLPEPLFPKLRTRAG